MHTDKLSLGEHSARYKTARGGTKIGILDAVSMAGQVHLFLKRKDNSRIQVGSFTRAEWLNPSFTIPVLHRAGVTSWK